MKIAFIAPVSPPFLDMVNRELNNMCKSLFIFHTKPKHRPSWWSNYHLDENSQICKKPREVSPGIYLTLEPLKYCIKFKPDVVVVHGSLSPSLWWVTLWAKYKNIPVILFTEPLGRGDSIFSRSKFFHSRLFRILFKSIYRDLGEILAVGQITEKYFSEDLQFGCAKVSRTQYPVDMSRLIGHPYRTARSDLVFLFPHRLVSLYDPITALKWFYEINKLFPETRFVMNGFGNLRSFVSSEIKRQGLSESVSFADSIVSWEGLHEVYRSADVILSTKHGRDQSIEYSWGISDWSIAEMDACASGMGLIVSKCSLGLNQLMHQTESGFIIESPSDLEAVLAAATQYITVDELLVHDGRRLRAAVKKYSVPEYAKNLYGLSLRLIEQWRM